MTGPQYEGGVDALGEKDLLKERPTNIVLRLPKVKLEQHSLFARPMNVVKQLMQDHNPIQNEAAFNERSLSWANDLVSDQGDLSSISFGRELRNVINKSNGSLKLDVICPFELGQKGEGGII